MKKFVVLMLVLAVASLANAGVMLYIDGSPAASEITIGVGETVTLQVYSTDTSNYNAYVINGLDETAIGVLADPVTLSAAGDMSSNSPYTDGGGWGDGFLFGTAGSPASGTVVAGVQHTVGFSSSVEGIAYISLYDGTSYEELDSIAITIIPEPATIALLCLGGLLIRKKK